MNLQNLLEWSDLAERGLEELLKGNYENAESIIGTLKCSLVSEKKRVQSLKERWERYKKDYPTT